MSLRSKFDWHEHSFSGSNLQAVFSTLSKELRKCHSVSVRQKEPKVLVLLSPSHLSSGPLPDELPAADPELDTEHGRVSAPRARPRAKLVILYTLYTPGASLWSLAKPVTAEVLLLSVGAGAGRLEEGVGGHLRNIDQ